MGFDAGTAVEFHDPGRGRGHGRVLRRQSESDFEIGFQDMCRGRVSSFRSWLGFETDVGVWVKFQNGG